MKYITQLFLINISMYLAGLKIFVLLWIDHITILSILAQFQSVPTTSCPSKSESSVNVGIISFSCQLEFPVTEAPKILDLEGKFYKTLKNSGTKERSDITASIIVCANGWLVTIIEQLIRKGYFVKCNSMLSFLIVQQARQRIIHEAEKVH